MIYPLFIFFYIPITEFFLLPLKCNSEKRVDIVQDGIKCWENIHYLYAILGIIASIIFFISVFFLVNLFFYPFNYDESSIKIQSTNDSIFLIIKYIFVIRFVLVKNEYLSIAILFLFSLFNLTQEFFNHSYNNTRIEIFMLDIFYIIIRKIFFHNKNKWLNIYILNRNSNSYNMQYITFKSIRSIF